MITSDWSDVPGRIAKLAAHPGAGSVFGANRHQWRLERTLTEDELAEVELELGIGLPHEYRSFLLQVSRGGAGPGCGLFPLHRVDGRWRWDGDGADLTELETLSRSFPHIEAFNPADDLPGPPEREDFGSEEDFNAAEDAYWQKYDAVVAAPEHTIGLLFLCHLGCAYFEALVVSGPARGQMWADDTAGDGGFRPLRGTGGSPTGFTRWYRGWLEQAEELAGSA